MPKFGRQKTPDLTGTLQVLLTSKTYQLGQNAGGRQPRNGLSVVKEGFVEDVEEDVGMVLLEDQCRSQSD